MTYGREQLLFLGKKFLTSDHNYRLPTSAWCKIRSLGLQTTKSTKRGKRGGKRKQKYLRSALINARLIKNKATEINDFITSKELDLIFITETWLLGDGKDNLRLLNYYRQITKLFTNLEKLFSDTKIVQSHNINIM